MMENREKIQCACGTAKGSKPAQKSRSDPTGTEALDPEIKNSVPPTDFFSHFYNRFAIISGIQ